jgi:predicted DNA binding CopG/RHH family protein
MDKNKTKWVQVRISESEQAEIKVHSDKLGLSFSSFIRFLIKSWINKQEK